MDNPRQIFRLNVGFIVNFPVGHSRDFIFEEIPFVHLQPDLDLYNLSGTARITRTPQGLLVQVRMRAATRAECVRCLTDFQLPLAIDFAELYAFSERTTSESGLILPEDGNIDLSPLIREYMLLEIPINALCSQACRGLCPVCGESLNDNPHEHALETGDPRLAILKDFLEHE